MLFDDDVDLNGDGNDDDSMPPVNLLLNLLDAFLLVLNASKGDNDGVLPLVLSSLPPRS